MDTKLKKNKDVYLYLLLPAAFLGYALFSLFNMENFSLVLSLDPYMGLEPVSYWRIIRYLPLNGFFSAGALFAALLAAAAFFGLGIRIFKERTLRFYAEPCLLIVGLWIWQSASGYNIYHLINGLWYYSTDESFPVAYCITFLLTAFAFSWLFVWSLLALTLSVMHKTFRDSSLLFRFVTALTRKTSIRVKLLAECLLAFALFAGAAALAAACGIGRIIPSVALALVLLAVLFFAVMGFVLLGKNSAAGEMERLAAMLRDVEKGVQILENPLKKRAMLYETGESLVRISGATKEGIEKGIAGEKLKVELISNMSHDLRTPLTAIIGYGEELLSMAESDVGLSEEACECIKKLNNKAFYLKTMVDDLFDLSKTSAGAGEFTISEFDVCRLMEQTLGLLDEKIQTSGFEIRRSYPDEPVLIKSDGARLHRVFQNLIDNALKYSLTGTRIYVEVVPEGRVSIMNTSAYDMSECTADLTERFVRGDKARSGEGSGIGLAIVKTYVEALGGTFDIVIRGDQFEAVVGLPYEGGK